MSAALPYRCTVRGAGCPGHDTTWAACRPHLLADTPYQRARFLLQAAQSRELRGLRLRHLDQLTSLARTYNDPDDFRYWSEKARLARARNP